MYYPYLRGRQNELLCLRELLEAKKLSKCVTPVLEPVKFSSTFVSTLKKFAENERQIILIMNPAVGKFEDEFQKAIVDSKKADTDEKRTKLKKLLDEYDSILKDKHICKAYLVDAETIDKVLKMSEAEREKLYLLNQNRGNDEFYIEHGNELLVEASFIPKDEDFKRKWLEMLLFWKIVIRKQKERLTILMSQMYFLVKIIWFMPGEDIRAFRIIQ